MATRKQRAQKRKSDRPRRTYNANKVLQKAMRRDYTAWLKTVRLKFEGSITDDLRRVCDTNVTAEELKHLAENLNDWHVTVEAHTEWGIEQELKIFRGVFLEELSLPLVEMQKSVKKDLNEKQLLRTTWVMRLAEPGEIL